MARKWRENDGESSMARHFGALGLLQEHTRRHSGGCRCFVEALFVDARLDGRRMWLQPWPMIRRRAAAGRLPA
jgi:hypothetical protein